MVSTSRFSHCFFLLLLGASFLTKSEISFFLPYSAGHNTNSPPLLSVGFFVFHNPISCFFPQHGFGFYRTFTKDYVDDRSRRGDYSTCRKSGENKGLFT